MGWRAPVTAQCSERAFFFLCYAESLLYCSIARLQRAIRHLVMKDREKHLQHLAYKAVSANFRGDFRTTAAIINMLAGKHRPQSGNVKLLDGSVACDDTQRNERWQEHFCNVFSGTVCDHSNLLDVLSAPRVNLDTSTFQTNPARTLVAFKRLPKNKGLVGDGISAELLCAGGMECAFMFDCLHQRILREGWPLHWCGGRIVDLWRCKGDPEICDNSRGLLLSDHSSQAFIGQLRSELEPKHQKNSPCDQYGGMAAGGTDFAHHVVLSFIDYCKMFHFSYFLLFLDLVKAYDRIVRELVFGWPAGAPSDRIEYLISIGVDNHAAKWIADYLDANGCLCSQWCVDPLVAELLTGLHEATWLRYGELETVIHTLRGARQGCKIGGTVFNACYSIAINWLRHELQKEHVTLRLACPTGAFWIDEQHDSNGGCEHDIVDVQFVDDECAMLCATSPKLLDRAIELLLERIVIIFKLICLEINWGVGKTECMLKYRGDHSTLHYQKHCTSGKFLSMFLDA